MTSKWCALVLIIGMSLFGWWAHSQLHTPVPVHSNEQAQVDLWVSPLVAVLVIPLVSLGLYLAVLIGRRTRPVDGHDQYLYHVSWLLLNLVVVFLSVVYGALLGRALWWITEVRRAVVFAFGLLTLVVGYYIPRARLNQGIGIRTPWTLVSPSVWEKTHRFGGWAFAIGGLLICLAAWLQKPYRRNLSMIGFICTILAPAIYSYVVWRRESRKPPSP